MLQRLIDIIVREGNFYDKSKCEPCGQNAPGCGNLGYVSSGWKAWQLCESLKSCLLSSLNFEAVDCKQHVIKEFWYLRLIKHELLTFLMPRQNFKSVWMQSRCTVPAWSWWDLRTGFPKTASELLIQPHDHRGGGADQRGLGPLWASLEEQWLQRHWERGRGTPCLSRRWRTGLASVGALLVQEKAVAAVALGLALTSSNFMFNAQSEISMV